jgi:hypothetical protein
MEIDFQHWAVIGAALVLFERVEIFFVVRRHEEKPSDEHIFK